MSAVSAVAVIAALEDRDAMGRGLRVEFFRLRDRYAHRILAVGCEVLPVLLLESHRGRQRTSFGRRVPHSRHVNLEDLQATTIT